MPDHCRLQFPCPCYQYNGKVLDWYHYGCGGTLHIHENGDLRCISCNDRDFIQKWRFQCTHQTQRNPEGEWVKLTSYVSFTQAWAAAATALAQDGEQFEGMANLLINLHNRWEKQ